MRMDPRLLRGLGTGVVTLFLAGGAVFARYGQVWVNCSHTDTKGAFWSKY